MAGSAKPCAATFVGMRGVQEQLAVEQPHAGRRRIVPAYTLPEDAARSLAAATRYSQWRARARSEPVAPFGIDHDAAEQIIAAVLAEDPARAPADPRRRRAGCWQPMASRCGRGRSSPSADEAADAATRLGLPSVLQVRTARAQEQAGPTALRADLHDADAVRQAFASLVDRLGALPEDRFFVQAMSPPARCARYPRPRTPSSGPWSPSPQQRSDALQACPETSATASRR